MPIEPRREKFKLVVEPTESHIFSDRGASADSDLDIALSRRPEGAGPDVNPGPRTKGRTGHRARPALLAAIIVLAFGGIAWYAYDWGTGEMRTAGLPLVQADPEPIKLRPETPGGLEIPHQDKLVLNEITPNLDKPQVERLLPPPEVPKPPSVAEATSEPLPLDTAAGPSESQDQTDTTDTQAVVALPKDTDSASGDTVTEQATSASKPVATDTQVAAQQPSAESPVTKTPAQSATAGAQPKPQEPKTQEPKAPEAKSAAPKTVESKTAAKSKTEQVAAVPKAKQAPAGSFVVQLASMKSQTATKPAWLRLQKAHPNLLGDRDLSVQKADLGSRGIYYRVQAGFFPDRASATALCKALKSRRQDCLVVKR